MSEDEDPYTHDTWTPLGTVAAGLVSKLRGQMQPNCRAEPHEENSNTKVVDAAFEQRSKDGFHRVSKYRKTAGPGT
ncbi:hypothetical protein [Bradyrhizobium sp. STM 3843]|uniref:hypothetical protein n=1 Tax=Bradyrhizobium sp. STM 3843 TaxID=551947 RepID=UPI001112B0A9|nr:hypothetical protein [Bradyrhizobium sp. STM 3843]